MDDSSFNVVILSVVCGGWLLTALLLYWFFCNKLGMCRDTAESFATIIATFIWVVIALIGCVFFKWGVEAPVTAAVLIVVPAS